ncbi:HSP20-like chaperone [Cladochytrium replicatum]|nr:HSP20-like chaperone [Cladochytrium replicatum]
MLSEHQKLSLEDEAEIRTLLLHAHRPAVRELLNKGLAEIESLHSVPQQVNQVSSTEVSIRENHTNVSPLAPPHLTRIIDKYGWTESSESVTIYITIDALASSPPEEPPQLLHVDNGIEMFAVIKGILYKFKLSNLHGEIDEEGSMAKVKKDKVVVILRKKVKGNWGSLKRKENAKKPSLGTEKEEDPSASIMKMMKQMYDEGDDDMKRTLAKAWTEANDKRARGGMMT